MSDLCSISHKELKNYQISKLNKIHAFILLFKQTI
jgi:hypothetical protein